MVTAVKCEICLKNEAKYKCPACQRQTCSLPCSKKHKELFSCTGLVDPTRYVPVEKIVSDPSVLNRDYSFLQRLDREIHLKRENPLLKTAGKSTKRRNFKKDEYRRGVHVIFAPSGLQRVAQNRSGWNRAKDEYEWTVEFIVLAADGQEIKRRILNRVLERTPSVDVYSRVVPEEGNWMYLVFLSVDSKTIKPVHIWGENEGETKAPPRTLAEVIKDETVLEFPTFVLVQCEINEQKSVPRNGFIPGKPDVDVNEEVMRVDLKGYSIQEAESSSEDSSSSDSSSDSSSGSDDESDEEKSKDGEAKDAVGNEGIVESGNGILKSEVESMDVSEKRNGNFRDGGKPVGEGVKSNDNAVSLLPLGDYSSDSAPEEETAKIA